MVFRRVRRSFQRFRSQKHDDTADRRNDNQFQLCPKTRGAQEPRNLWQEAYDKLDDKQKLNLEAGVEINHTDARTIKRSDDDGSSGLIKALNSVIETVEQQYEIRTSKRNNNRLRESAKKILTATLSVKGVISAVAAFDPTGHATSAWTVVSLGLAMTQNYVDQQAAWFESSAFLTDVLARYALIERFYRDDTSVLNEGLENSIVRVYKAALSYAAEVLASYKAHAGKRLLKSVIALTDLPLTTIQSSIEKEEERLGKWIEMYQDSQRKQEAESILKGVDAVFAGIQELTHKMDLSKLPIADGAHYNSHTDENEDSCLPGTRVGLLDDIMRWVDDPQAKSILWLNGVAGSGKSTISRTVARLLQNRDLLGATFFFKRDEEDRSDTKKFVTTIVTQLMAVLPPMKKDIAEVIEADPMIYSKALREQFQKLFLQPLQNMKVSSGNPILVALVIDALDECDDERIEMIIRLLPQVQQSTSVQLRVFVTSRPESHILSGFDKIAGSHRDVVLHDIEDRVIEHDISLLFRQRFTEIRREHLLPEEWPGKENSEALVKMAVPLFISAATMCRVLEDRRWDPNESLKEILNHQEESSKLDGTYLPVLAKLLLDLHPNKKARLVQEFRQVVGAIIVLQTPVSILSLSRLIEVPTGTITKRLETLHSVLNIPKSLNQPVKLFHLSFREFLLSPAIRSKTDLWVDSESTHRELALRCIAIMSGEGKGGLRRDMCDMKNYGVLRAEISPEVIQRGIPSELRYSCRHWVYHMQQGQYAIHDGNQAHTFLLTHFLHWLEVMSLLGYLSDTVGCIESLRSLVANNGSQISKFLLDAKRFILKNIWIADTAPLQLYSSALVFAPQRSIIRNVFSQDIPNCFSKLPIVEADWGAELQTLIGHSEKIKALSFSPDGKRLASGSNDQTVRLCDPTTGELQHVLGVHKGPVWRTAFSSDGRFVASCSEDRTVRVWETGSGALKHEFLGHSGKIYAVEFLQDQEIVSASDDGTVLLWDVDTGGLMRSIRWGSNLDSLGEITTLSLFPERNLLVSGHFDLNSVNPFTVRLWNITTGSIQHVFEGHNWDIHSTEFSPDGNLIASGDDGGFLKLWDTRQGTLEQTIQCHQVRSRPGCQIKGISFSRDAKSLATACDHGVRLWDATGNMLYQYHSVHEVSSSVALSPGGGQLASGYSGPLKLWDTTLDNLPPCREFRTGRVITMDLSPDENLIAFASSGGTIQMRDMRTGAQNALSDTSCHNVRFSSDSRQVAGATSDLTSLKVWDTATGSLLHTLLGSSEELSKIAFSPDGRLIAVCSRRDAIELWDTHTGVLKHKWDLDISSETLQFSPNSEMIAAGSVDRKVTVWDTFTGSPKHILIGHSGEVSSVAFVPGTSLIASISTDGLMIVWDLETGKARHTNAGHAMAYAEIVSSSDGTLIAADMDTLQQSNPMPPKKAFMRISRDRQYLETASGRYNIRPLGENVDRPWCPSKYDMVITHDWLVLGGEKVLWLPIEYRPSFCSMVRGDKVIVGVRSGEISIIELNTSVGLDKWQ
ncbi:hypothetical protein N8T08_002997 [Aspergillus melleus]|uniref:Uncharacterized protein n=1 Tax=Aspergillus melleus TaxID=138277 RepID=A0ACC3B7N5_9EURO|nr:hypothetical protein N8T08_002997 [Aspergillus melleus]